MVTGRNLEVPRGGALSARGPASVDYAPAAEVGFEIVPSVVRARLFAAAMIGSKALCASCEALRVRRRSNATHYQSAKAWWGDETRALMVTVEREMSKRGSRQYSPNGMWNATGTLYRLGATDRPLTTTWRFDAQGSTGAASPQVVTDDPLDLLPAEVAAPIRGGLSDVWREHSRTSAAEYLTAIRIVNDRVLLLEAHRSATTIRQLLGAEWVLTTLDAPITGHESIRFTCDDDELENSSRPSPHLGPGTTT